jgi:hypothetical protein
MSGLGTALGNLIMIFTGVLLIPAIAVFIVLLIKCIKNKWKRGLLAPFIVVSIVITIIIICEVSYLIDMKF